MLIEWIRKYVIKKYVLPEIYLMEHTGWDKETLWRLVIRLDARVEYDKISETQEAPFDFNPCD